MPVLVAPILPHLAAHHHQPCLSWLMVPLTSNLREHLPPSYHVQPLLVLSPDPDWRILPLRNTNMVTTCLAAYSTSAVTHLKRAFKRNLLWH